MSFLNNYISIIKNEQIQFVSIKFLDKNSQLSQIDFNIQHLDSINSYLPQTSKFIATHGFIDPFRSRKTFSVFCYDLEVATNYRELLGSVYNDINLTSAIFELSFYVDKSLGNQKDLFLAVEPDDKLADLRADIATIMQNIGINVVYHYHGEASNECVIAINAKSAVALADQIVILKYAILNIAVSYGYQASFENDENKAKISLKYWPHINLYRTNIELKDFANRFIIDKMINKKVNDSNSGETFLLFSKNLLDNPYLLLVLFLKENFI